MLLTSINHTDVQLVSSEHDIMPGHQIIILKILGSKDDQQIKNIFLINILLILCLTFVLKPVENCNGLCTKAARSNKVVQQIRQITKFSVVHIVLVVITCSKKTSERVQAAAKYSPIIPKHRTQINLSSHCPGRSLLLDNSRSCCQFQCSIRTV